MNSLLIDDTRITAYFLWEETKHDHALSLWYCAEDIACYLEDLSITSAGSLAAIIGGGVYSYAYIDFVRHLAYRIYIYTNNDDADSNWFAAERLLKKKEWTDAITEMAHIYNTEKDDSDFVRTIRSGKVRGFYGS